MRWQFRAAEAQLVSQLAAEARLPVILARLLAQRGIGSPEDAEAFLHPQLRHLHSPYAMQGMRAAVERLLAAIERREKVLIYGDYDADGATATIILKTAIELCGGSADFHVPHRIREGYGMKEDVIERAAGEDVRLIISVDTGIRAFAAAESARRVGLDLIVTDHHLPHADGVPQAVAVLNPNQSGCAYPCKALCGAGVTFKLVQAVLEHQGRERLLPSFLKMVAIATIADAVPLTGENRVIARLGLDGLRNAVNPGLKALLEVAGLDPARRVTGSDVAFRIAPRINAAGRMDIAATVIELFCTRDEARAREVAQLLNQLNADRQDEERRIMTQVEERVNGDAALRDSFCMLIDGEGWHRGVIGIAATRVVEQYGRPALVVTREGDEAHGSGRSVPSFHLLQSLEACAGLFTRFGGHAHAVGFSLPAERLPELRSALDAYARARLTLADFEQVQEIDAEITLQEITPDLFCALEQLHPFGMENPEPVFAARGVKVVFPPRVMKDEHLKVRVFQPGGLQGGRALDALGWWMAERLQQEPLLAGDLLDIAFRIEKNSHPDFGGLQLSLCDYRRAAAAAVSNP